MWQPCSLALKTVAYAHRPGYCMYYGFCGSDSDLSGSGTTENSCEDCMNMSEDCMNMSEDCMNLSGLLTICMRILLGVKTQVRVKFLLDVKISSDGKTEWAT